MARPEDGRRDMFFLEGRNCLVAGLEDCKRNMAGRRKAGKKAAGMCVRQEARGMAGVFFYGGRRCGISQSVGQQEMKESQESWAADSVGVAGDLDSRRGGWQKVGFGGVRWLVAGWLADVRAGWLVKN